MYTDKAPSQGMPLHARMYMIEAISIKPNVISLQTIQCCSIHTVFQLQTGLFSPLINVLVYDMLI